MAKHSKRHAEILRLVGEEGTITIADLATKLEVSLETVRRDVKPLTSDVIASIFDTRQYARQPIAPLPMSVVRTLEGGAQIVRIGGGRGGNYAAPRFLASQRTLGEPDWRLITMASIDPVNVSCAHCAARA